MRHKLVMLEPFGCGGIDVQLLVTFMRLYKGICIDARLFLSGQTFRELFINFQTVSVLCCVD